MEKLFGFIFGVVVSGLLLGSGVLIGMKKSKTDGRLFAKYDERQQLVRGKGWKYGFFTMVGADAIYAVVVDILGFVPCHSVVSATASIILGVMVYCVYCIMHDGYYGLNENRRTCNMIFLFIGLANLVISIMGIIHGEVIVDGQISLKATNLLCAILMFVILGASIIKEAIEKKEES